LTPPHFDVAADYNQNTGVWDNRATFGPVSVNNGDFTSNGNAVTTWPTTGTFAAPGSPGALGVFFNHAAFAGPQHLETSYAYFPATTIFGSSDWTFEVGAGGRASRCSATPQNFRRLHARPWEVR
jgi:hypothetical protein